MKLRYLGHSSFLLVSDAGTAIVTDPYDGIGFSLPLGLSADFVTVSHGHFDHCNLSAVGGDPAVFREAGKFSANDVTVEGFPCFHDDAKGARRGKNLIFKFAIDGLTVCHLGDLGEPFSPALQRIIAPADVLLIPVGGTYTIDAAAARTYVEQIRPAVAIPMHYKSAGHTLDISPVDKFLSEVRSFPIERAGSDIELRRETVAKSGTKIIVMERFQA